MAFPRKSALERLSSILAHLSSGTPSKIHTKNMIASLVVALDPIAEQALMALDLSAANTREEVMDAFAKANPDLSKEELEAFADNWEKNKNVVKDKAAARLASAGSISPSSVKDLIHLSHKELSAKMQSATPKALQERLFSLLPRLAVRGPVELEIPAIWESPTGPVEVLISGYVSPVIPATRESPAEGGVEGVAMVEKATNKPVRMDRDDKDWAADMLTDAAKKKHMILGWDRLLPRQEVYL